MFCGKCGKETTEGNLYCIYCGNKLENNNNNIENKSDSPTITVAPVKENKIDIPTKEEIQLKNDTVNIETETSSNNTKTNEPSTIWLNILSGWWFICGIIGLIKYSLMIFNCSTAFISIWGISLNILRIIADSAIIKHKQNGYYLFLIIIYSPIITIFISILNSMLLPGNDIDMVNLFTGFIIELIIAGIWVTCNYIYISKRKESYFNIKD